MNLYTLNRGFLRQSSLDEFLSVIWTERYYGDGAIELVVPGTTEMIKKLPEGTFIGLEGSDEIMIIETVNIENGNLKASGISLLPWLNNRFVRTSPNHEDRYWYLSDGPAGWKCAICRCVDSPHAQYGRYLCRRLLAPPRRREEVVLAHTLGGNRHDRRSVCAEA